MVRKTDAVRTVGIHIKFAGDLVLYILCCKIEGIERIHRFILGGDPQESGRRLVVHVLFKAPAWGVAMLIRNQVIGL